MATYIFDFDDTLYDNMALREDVRRIFKKHGISEQKVEDTYKNVRHLYNYEKHVEAVKSIHTEIDTLSILKELNSLPFNQYTFYGVHEILENLQQKNKLILLTFGDRNFQQRKLDASGVLAYFHEVVITQKHKAETLKELEVLDKEVYFLNDKQMENDVIGTEFTHFKIIHVSPENPVSKINWEK